MTRRVKFIPLRRVDMYLGKGALDSFSKIYTNTIQAMADFDYDYLSGIMEPKLYEACKDGLDYFKDKKYTLEYLEQTVYDPEASDSEEELDGVVDRKSKQDDSKFMGVDLKDSKMGDILNGPMGYVYGQKDLQMYIEARGAFGVNITRSKNKTLKRRLGSDATAMSFYRGPNTSWRDLWKRQVLILDIYYYTSRKLTLKDDQGDVIDGSDSPKDLFDHKFRFETYSDRIDWVLTDIDEYLHGNPFVPPNKIEVETE